ncbi:MAG: integrase arm-type DNA-binding domain-containing protein [Dokdonella sp.]
MPLNDSAIRAAKPGERAQKLFDGGGLFLLVNPNGSRYWRLKYRIGGKEKLLGLGVYPAVSLKLARERRHDARKLIAARIDPSAKRQADKIATEDTFEAIAREWFAKFKPNWVAGHSDKIIGRLERDVFPFIGSHPIASIRPADVLTCLRKIEKRGALETAHRAKQNVGQVFRYAVATGRTERDPSADLRGALAPVRGKHHASITDPVRIGELLRAIDDYQGTPIAQVALKLAPLVFVRPVELRSAEWSEIDLDTGEWQIPATKMKMRQKHIVPLSSQAVAALRELHPLTGARKGAKFVFPSMRTADRQMSENTVLAALRRLGYSKDEMTGHGFRSMASTLLNEQGWNRDAIERQLAHTERDNVRAAYNYAEHLPERRKMMQAWADYLDGLRTGANVVAIKRKARA